MSIFFNDTATTEIYTLSLHDALPILTTMRRIVRRGDGRTSEDGLYRSQEGVSGGGQPLCHGCATGPPRAPLVPPVAQPRVHGVPAAGPSAPGGRSCPHRRPSGSTGTGARWGHGPQ